MWEWSHSVEAYADARTNLENMPHEWLAECLAEWQASRFNEYGMPDLRMNRWDKNLQWAQQQPDDILIDIIWERAETARNCNIGGWDAYMCPYGCHTVPFSCDDTTE